MARKFPFHRHARNRFQMLFRNTGKERYSFQGASKNLGTSVIGKIGLS